MLPLDAPAWSNLEPQARLPRLPLHETQPATPGKKRLPQRLKQPLDVPQTPGRLWSMDFMHDTLYHGQRFRTLNVFDKGVREALAIEIDTSLPAARFIRTMERLKENRGLPHQIRVDNGPEFISSKLIT